VLRQSRGLHENRNSFRDLKTINEICTGKARVSRQQTSVQSAAKVGSPPLVPLNTNGLQSLFMLPAHPFDEDFDPLPGKVMLSKIPKRDTERPTCTVGRSVQ